MIFGVAMGVAVATAVIVIKVSRTPAEFTIERSATFRATPAAAFALVNDFHKWPSWSPWAKLDPDMKVTFGGPDTGVGSTYEWSGNNKVGAGKMIIRESEQNARVGLELAFFRPMAANNQGEFKFERTGDGVRVTWSMRGTRNFVAKAFATFVDIDKLVGGDFEKGLAELKRLSESAPAQLSA